ncbi:MAG: hypothetical protein ABTQ73_05955 [Caldilineales bacterium]
MSESKPRSIDHALAAKRENRLLLGVAAGLGCLLLVCAVGAALVFFLALYWTLQGQLGPAGSLLLPLL